MCGIIGYLGKKEATPILVHGLRQMEYRGYDSAGVAVIAGDDAGIGVCKKMGKIHNLEEALQSIELKGNVGIAHTRWATHGVPSDANAHPHSDCGKKIYVVHNGIIENFRELKQKLENEGHVFASGTDTEVLAHLIEKHYKDTSLEKAVRESLSHVHGTYGIAVVASDEPEKIVAARLGSPLILGIVSNGEYIVASDVTAILRHTREVIYLDDGEVVTLTPKGYSIAVLNGEKIHKEVETVEWDVSQAEKAGFPHFMLKEIFEQDKTFEDVLRGRLVLEEGLVRLGGLLEVKDRLQKANRVTIVACGTAYYAGLVGKYMLEEYAGIPTEVEFASEFRYRKPVLQPEKDVVIAISQSGETADTLAAIREAKQKQCLTLGVVNVIGSTIARDVDAGVYSHAGPEIGVASTKAFTTQLGALAMITVFLGRQRQMSLVMGQRILKELQELPRLIQKTLKLNENIKAMAEKYSSTRDFLYLGRKYNYPIALEGALKLKEISYIHAEGYPAGEMKHGPLALIDENFPSLFIAPRDSVYEKVISNLSEIKARRGKVIALATEGDEDIPSIADDVLFIPKTLEMLTPILAAIPLQLFAYHCAVALGRNVDQPRNLAKSVTVE